MAVTQRVGTRAKEQWLRLEEALRAWQTAKGHEMNPQKPIEPQRTQHVGWAEVRSPTNPIFLQNTGVDVLGLLGFAIKPLSPTYMTAVKALWAPA